MRFLTDWDNPIINVIAKAFDLFILTLLWIFLCCTVIGIGPACVALYYSVVKTIRRDRSSSVKEFLRSIKDSWKVSLPIGLLVAIFIVSTCMIDYPNILILFSYETTYQLFAGILSCLKVLFLLAIMVYIFPIISRFQAGVIKSVTSSVMLLLRHFIATILMILIVVVAAISTIVLPLLIVIVPAATAFVLSFVMEPILLLYTASDDKEVDVEKDQWYLGQ